MRKLLFYFNLAATLSCILWALIAVEPVFAGYFYLGIFQVLTSLIISFIAFSEQKNSGFLIYWLMVVGFFTLIAVTRLNHAVFMVLPMLIALYNCYAYYRFYKVKF